MNRRQLSKIVGLVVTLAAVALLAYAVTADYSSIKSRLHLLSWSTLLVSLACCVAGVGVTVFAWRALLADLGSTVGARDAFGIYFAGQLGKYLPGAVWPVVAQVRLGKRHRIPAAASAAAAVLSLGMSLVAAVLLALVLLPLSAGHELHKYVLVYLLVPAALVVLWPSVLNRLLATLLRVTKRAPLPRPLSGRALSIAMGWLCVQWLLIGVGVALLARGVGADGIRTFPLAIGGYSLSWSVGFLVLVVPAGAGVRESIFAALLAPVLPLSGGGGLLVALVARLWLTLADAVLGTLGLALARRALGADAEPAAVAAPDGHSGQPTAGLRKIHK